MTSLDPAKVRLKTQHISGHRFATPKNLLGWMGAVQAQDYEMTKWAIGIRLPGSTLETVEFAIARGDIIRTHLLRPTWHFVAAKDLRWMLALTAPRVKIALRSRHKYLGLTKELITKSNNMIQDALAGESCLTRKQLVGELERAGFKNKDNLASHLLIRAELDGIICSGPTKGKNYTYALLDERVPKSEAIPKEEALERLARIYFKSHGPATLDDFTWWSGLTKSTARKAMEKIKADFNTEEFHGAIYWFSSREEPVSREKVFLLPAFDEFIISYKNRIMLIPDDENRKKTISNNGIFRPVIVVDGQIVGIWKRSVKKDTVKVELGFFNCPSRKVKTQAEIAAEQFAAFLDKRLEIE